MNLSLKQASFSVSATMTIGIMIYPGLTILNRIITNRYELFQSWLLALVSPISVKPQCIPPRPASPRLADSSFKGKTEILSPTDISLFQSSYFTIIP